MHRLGKFLKWAETIKPQLVYNINYQEPPFLFRDAQVKRHVSFLGHN